MNRRVHLKYAPYDSNLKALAAGIAHGGTLGVMAPFKAELQVNEVPEGPLGTIEAYEVDMRDGSEREKVILRVVFYSGPGEGAACTL